MDLRQQLEIELASVLAEEDKSMSPTQATGNTGLVPQVQDNYQVLFAAILNHASKIEKAGGTFEAVQHDADKLNAQIQACQGLSEKLSSQIKRLDLMYTRANDTLTYVEDVLNLKEAKHHIALAISNGDLNKAVTILRKVHSLQSLHMQPTDDYTAIKEAEVEVQTLVRKELANSIESSNVAGVMKLCPLLQSLGLEVEARDEFLAFMDRAVFAAISADEELADRDSLDLATAYAQILSHIFNASYSIMQQYLPMVIEGMEASQGDIHFIRRLHHKCEREAGIVLKRYMKYRHVRDTVAAMKSESSGAPTASPVSSAEVHTILDELSVLIQYSCTYTKYIQQLCVGAESRSRDGVGAVKVFSGATDFMKMIEEMVQRYYVEGERWLMTTALRAALKRHVDGVSTLDEGFFVLQRCGQRAIASQDADAAAVILRSVSLLFTGDLLKDAQEISEAAASQVASALRSRMTRHWKTLDPNYTPEQEVDSGTLNISKSLQSLYSTGASANESAEAQLSLASEAFALIATCQRYIDRLSKDLRDSADQLFVVPVDADKLRKCHEDMAGARLAFSKVMTVAIEQVVHSAHVVIKDILSHNFGHLNRFGGIRFDVSDEQFDSQPGVAVQPQTLLAALEILLETCTAALPEHLKDSVVGALADACCDKFERFITQTTFCFSGAVKMEECSRGIISLLNKHSGTSIRAKFARIKEITTIITDSSPTIVTQSSQFNFLTSTEIAAFASLRSFVSMGN